MVSDDPGDFPSSHPLPERGDLARSHDRRSAKMRSRADGRGARVRAHQGDVDQAVGAFGGVGGSGHKADIEDNGFGAHDQGDGP